MFILSQVSSGQVISPKCWVELGPSHQLDLWEPDSEDKAGSHDRNRPTVVKNWVWAGILKLGESSQVRRLNLSVTKAKRTEAKSETGKNTLKRICASTRMAWVRNGNPPQCSYLGTPMDRGTWRATVHRVARSQTRLSTQNGLDAWLEPVCWA